MLDVGPMIYFVQRSEMTKFALFSRFAWQLTLIISASPRFCIFIYLQSRMTNQLGNFKVGPDAITSATCEEGEPDVYIEGRLTCQNTN